MARHTRAIAIAALVVVSVAAPAMGATASVDSLSVDVAQSDGVTVTVTNGTANGTVENASVNVTTLTENVTYAGAGNYTTGPNGTVGLPAPNRSVRVSVTATVGNASATTTANLTAASDENETSLPFGLRVVGFIAGLNDTDGPRGLAIAGWVTAHNPGNADGPPAWAGPGNETGNHTQGPPDHAGNGNKTQGPPEDAGTNETGNHTQGPPDHAGNAGNGGHGDENGNGNGNDGHGNGGAKAGGER